MEASTQEPAQEEVAMTFKTISPLRDLVLLKPLPAPSEEKRGSLYVPLDPRLAPHREAIVAAVGPGVPSTDGTPIPLTVKVGDRVMYEKRPGFVLRVKVSDQDLIIVREADILGVLRETATGAGSEDWVHGFEAGVCAAAEPPADQSLVREQGEALPA